MGALFQQMILEIKRIANRTKYPDVVARIAHYIQSTYHENIEIISSKDIYIDFEGNLLYNGRHQGRKAGRGGMEHCFWGIDIGGTKTTVGLFDERAAKLTSMTMPTSAREGFQSLIERIGRGAEELRKAQEIPRDRIFWAGVACPGPLDLDKGTIVYIPTMGFRDAPLAASLQEVLGTPVSLESDTNAAVLGECVFGKGKGLSTAVYITVSTGVGCGIAVDGRIVDGGRFAAGELGHMKTARGGRTCSCGGRGCLEAYASGTALAAIATQRTGREMDAKAVCAAARRGEEPCGAIVRRAADHLGLAIGAVYQLLDPDIVILGGSVMKDFDVWEPLLHKALHRYMQPIPGRVPRLEVSDFGGEQVVMGAACLAKERAAEKLGG